VVPRGHCWKNTSAQGTYSSVQYYRCLLPFSCNAAPFPLKTCHLSTNLRFSLKLSTYVPFIAWEDYHNFYFAFGASFGFWEAYFHFWEGRETLSRSHKDLNSTDDKMKLRACPH
jgi:hypothetical protein